MTKPKRGKIVGNKSTVDPIVDFSTSSGGPLLNGVERKHSLCFEIVRHLFVKAFVSNIADKVKK